MIKYKSSLSKKDKMKVRMILDELTDIYGDFFITKDCLRLYIKENQPLLFSYLNKGDKIFFCDDGILIVTGFADKIAKIYDKNTDEYKEVKSRKYVKILAKTEKAAGDLVKILSWEINSELFVKIKKRNPIYNVLLNNGYKFLGGRGAEILLKKIRRTNRDRKNYKQD